VIELGGGPAAVGIVVASSTVPLLILILFGGIVGDRFERRKIILLTESITGVLLGVSALLVFTGTAQVWHLAAIQVGMGACFAFYAPASVGIIPELLDSESIQVGNSWLAITKNTGDIAGPTVGGLLIAAGSSGYAFAVDCASFAISALLMTRIPRSNPSTPAQRSFLREFKEGFDAVKSRPWVAIMMLNLSGYHGLVLPAIYVLSPLIVASKFGGPQLWGAILSARGIGAVLGGIIALKWRPKWPLVACIACLALDIPFLAWIIKGNGYLPLIFFAVVSALGMILSETLWDTTVQRSVPTDQLSRLSSFAWLGPLSLNPIGFALAGVLGSAFGLETMVLVAIIFLLASRPLIINAAAIRNFKVPMPR
jgi:predicted MFS family arabinose efflux permease